LQQFGTLLARRRRRRHNVSLPFLSPILHVPGTAGCDLDHRLQVTDDSEPPLPDHAS
jgi:hypothetical protein